MTGTRRSAALRALFLTMLVSACDGGIRSSPTSQTPLPAAPPAATPVPVILIGTLSGVVFEVTSGGNAPVEGVRVYCDSCGAGHADSYTAGNGAYSFTDVKTSVYPLWVAKQGYNLAKPTGRAGIGWMGSINADVNGNTRFDIEIVRQ